MDKNYLLNAFSLQMVQLPATVTFAEVDSLPSLDTLVSAIGHQDTANVLGVPMNRVNVSLAKGDVAYVAQLVGGRLPEGSTTLPDGFMFKFVKVTVGWFLGGLCLSDTQVIDKNAPWESD